MPIGYTVYTSGYLATLPQKIRSNICTYAQALEKFESIKPYRGRPNDPRPIGTRSRKNETIRKDADNNIHVRHWLTDIITYHPDNSVTLNPYRSVTTNTFANIWVPHGITCDFNSTLGAVVWMDMAPSAIEDAPEDKTRGHLIPRGVRLVPHGPPAPSLRVNPEDRPYLFPAITDKSGMTWSIHPDGPQPEAIRTYTVSTAKSAKAFKLSGYRDFQKWSVAYAAMEPEKARAPVDRWGNRDWYPPMRMRDHEIVERLQAGAEEWPALMENYRDQTLTRVREALHVLYDCVECVEIPYITTGTQLRSIRQQQMKYQYKTKM